MSSLEQQQAAAREAFERFGREFGEAMLPAMQRMLVAFAQLSHAFGELTPQLELERERRRARRRSLVKLAASLAVIVAALVALALIVTSSASAHPLARVDAGMPLSVLEQRLERNVAHSRGAVRYLERRRRELGRSLAPRARERLAWHRAALEWQRESLARVRGARRPDLPPQAEKWLRLADCESGGDEYGRPPYAPVWDYNGSSGFDGGLQFLPSTWRSAVAVYDPSGLTIGRYPYAYLAPAGVQIEVAQAWLNVTSWLQWPSCSRSVGLR